jgi:hypothetical protein
MENPVDGMSLPGVDVWGKLGTPQNAQLPHMGGSTISGLMEQPGQGFADLGKLLGGFSQGQKANRALEGQFTQGYDQLQLQAQNARNQNESDALGKLGQTSYLLQGGSHFKPPTLNLNGKTYDSPDLGFGPTPVSDAEKAGAQALQGQLQARLSPGGSYSPTPLDNYAKPGLSEQIGNYGGLATSGLGALENLGVKGIAGALGGGGLTGALKGMAGLGNSTSAGVSGAGSTIGSMMSKALPIAGAITGGIGLLKNRGTASNLMNGISTGASIGSFAGPIGTGVGAGIGALAGYLRGIGGPSGKEKDGRSIEGNFEQSLGGFQGMMNTIGQGYAAHGHTSQEAQADAKAMLDAEKQGGPAVQSIIQSIMSKMGRQ